MKLLKSGRIIKKVHQRNLYVDDPVTTIKQLRIKITLGKRVRTGELGLGDGVGWSGYVAVAIINIVSNVLSNSF